MRKSFWVLAVFTFLLLFCLGCQEEPTAVQTDLPTDQGIASLAKGKPGNTKPTITLSVTPSVTFPGQTAYIDYEITASGDITDANITFIYDDNDDGGFEVLFAERVYRIAINCDGVQTYLSGRVSWNGEVYPACSSHLYNDVPMVFDHYASENPDVYLLSFQVIAGGMLAYNWTSIDEVPHKISVTPTILPDPFSIVGITASSNTPSTKKGKYAATLSATIECSEPGFTGGGQWQQSTDNGLSWGGLTDFSGCPNCGFSADVNSTVATTGNTLLVGPGTYRYTVKLLYSPEFSYLPNSIVQSNLVTVP